MAVGKPRGPVPKRDSERRRANKPMSQGAAVPETGPAGDRPDSLGFDFDAHPIIQSLWDVLGESAEAKFYSPADWQRVRLELFYGHKVLSGGQIGAMAWATFQSGLSELLISPADKRRAGIELKPKTVDPDEEAAVVQLAQYQASLGA
jgi:hypothetical protein